MVHVDPLLGKILEAHPVNRRRKGLLGGETAASPEATTATYK
ncbi:hypothetical protein [Candidatus Methanocrinis natronophilus]|uniref:Uncharacterized protein n=1 Tax=Candidatus Methanocrinis natronophilus TaxID=3033396 RepID=A0ABT5X8K0_9EURY|nr:hypothetical protein [Candidatus Methanocrinis natronophilus]MDF0591030.1 hypothetical protein [Candidatus Methanocrinis natronophilus]